MLHLPSVYYSYTGNGNSHLSQNSPCLVHACKWIMLWLPYLSATAANEILHVQILFKCHFSFDLVVSIWSWLIFISALATCPIFPGAYPMALLLNAELAEMLASWWCQANDLGWVLNLKLFAISVEVLFFCLHVSAYYGSVEGCYTQQKNS